MLSSTSDAKLCRTVQCSHVNRQIHQCKGLSINANSINAPLTSSTKLPPLVTEIGRDKKENPTNFKQI